jgi:Zn-dependent M16 (insulinase) family peptidase
MCLRHLFSNSLFNIIIVHLVAFQDFYNLVDVYLDAVFFPKCVDDFQTFQQEGWHYELDNPEEEITYKGLFAQSNLIEQANLHVTLLVIQKAFEYNPLIILGVVFNEMKGVYSQPDNIMGRVSQQVN